MDEIVILDAHNNRRIGVIFFSKSYIFEEFKLGVDDNMYKLISLEEYRQMTKALKLE